MIERELKNECFERLAEFLREECVSEISERYENSKRDREAWHEELWNEAMKGEESAEIEIPARWAKCKHVIHFRMTSEDWTEIEIFDEESAP